MLIIAFGHETNVGKDSATHYLVTHLRLGARGKSVRKDSFAHAAKMLVHQEYPLVKLPEFYDENRSHKDLVIPKYQKSARDLWIEKSNEVMKSNPLAFFDIVIQANKNADFLVISDLRYLHMAQAIKEKRGRCYKIERDVPKYEGLDREMDIFTAWDGKIDNNCSFSDLNYQMGEICDDILEGALNGA